MTQLALSDQQVNLVRVSGRIAPAILAFCREHVGREFHMQELSEAEREFFSEPRARAWGVQPLPPPAKATAVYTK